MITGTSQADVAIVVVPADKGGFEAAFSEEGQLKEHILLARTLGITEVIIAVNKMDACNFSEERYKEILENMKDFTKKKGFKEDSVQYCAYSGWTGDNLIEPSDKMPWYKGDTLLACLNKIKPPQRPLDKALRLPLQDVYKIQGIGTVPCGRIETGILKPKMIVYFAPANISTECKSIEMHHTNLEEAIPGDNVGFNVKGVTLKDISRGMVVGDSKNDPPKEVETFKAQVMVMNIPNEIKAGYTPVVDCHTCHIACKFEKLLAKIDKRTGKIAEEEPPFIKKNESCLAQMVPQKPMVVETYSTYGPLGRFAVRDMKRTVAVGVVKEIVRKDPNKAKVTASAAKAEKEAKKKKK